MADEPVHQAPTALSLLKQEIERFLQSDKPEVLCIRGKWGVGKTYTWERLLKECGTRHAAFDKYSYVSLFGLDNLDKLKASIFENTIPADRIGSDPTLETLDINLRSAAAIVAKAFKPNLAAAAEQATFLTVRNQIICIDDLERRGERLRIVDVLGLASLLKERRKCKIVLILNDEELIKTDHEAFDKYSEKVIDVSLVFEPTPKESAEIAFGGSASHERLLKAKTTSLGIANIRILKKLERLVNIVQPLLRNLDAKVLEQAVTTLVLFGWCVYGHEEGLLKFAATRRYIEDIVLNSYDEYEAEYLAKKTDIDPPTYLDYLVRHVTLSALDWTKDIMSMSGVGQHINNMRWFVKDVTDGGLRLFTSDRPVIMTNGLSHDTAELVLPISPTKAFIACNTTEIEDKLKNMSSLVFTRVSNRHTLAFAQKYAWHANDDLINTADQLLSSRAAEDEERWTAPPNRPPQVAEKVTPRP